MERCVGYRDNVLCSPKIWAAGQAFDSGFSGICILEPARDRTACPFVGPDACTGLEVPVLCPPKHTNQAATARDLHDVALLVPHLMIERTDSHCNTGASRACCCFRFLFALCYALGRGGTVLESLVSPAKSCIGKREE